MSSPQKSVAGICILSVLLASCGSSATVSTQTGSTNKTPAKYAQIQTIKKAPFTRSSKMIGQVEPKVQTVVSSLVSGTLKNINVDAGQTVSVGDILAAIDLSSSTLGTALNNANTSVQHANENYAYAQVSSQADLSSALTQLQVAQSNRNNTYASTEEQLQTAQIQLANIQTQAKNTNVSLSESLKSAQIGVDLAQKSLDNSQLSLDNFNANGTQTLTTITSKQSGLYATAQVTLQTLLASADNSLSQIDILFGITNANKYQSNSYRMYLWTKDSSLRPALENIFTTAQNIYDTTNTAFQSSHSYPQTDTSIADSITMLNDMVSLTQKATDYLNGTVPSANFSQTQLTADQTTVSALQTTFQTQLASLVSLQNSIIDINNSFSSTQTSLSTGRASLQTALQIAQTQLQSAKQTLVNTQAGNLTSADTLSGSVSLTQSQLQSTIIAIKTARDGVDNALKIAEQNYNSTQAKLASQLVSSKSQLDSSQGQLDIAQTQYQNGFIKAPFGGVVLQKNAQVGQTVSPGTPIVTIGDTSTYIIDMNVNASDVSYIHLWDAVTVESGSGSFSGTVSLIAPSLNPQTQLTDVQISFLNNTTAKKVLRLGDYVNVYKNDNTLATNSILVPFQSIIAGDQWSYRVFTVDDKNIAHLTDVKLGDQNSTMVQITDGLKEGDRVITAGTLNINDGDTVENISK